MPGQGEGTGPLICYGSPSSTSPSCRGCTGKMHCVLHQVGADTARKGTSGAWSQPGTACRQWMHRRPSPSEKACWYSTGLTRLRARCSSLRLHTWADAKQFFCMWVVHVGNLEFHWDTLEVLSGSVCLGSPCSNSPTCLTITNGQPSPHPGKHEFSSLHMLSHQGHTNVFVR